MLIKICNSNGLYLDNGGACASALTDEVDEEDGKGDVDLEALEELICTKNNVSSHWEVLSNFAQDYKGIIAFESGLFDDNQSTLNAINTFIWPWKLVQQTMNDYKRK